MADEPEKNKRRARGDGGLYEDAKGLHVGIMWIPGPDGKPKQKRVASKSKAVAVAKLNKLRADVLAGNVGTTPGKVKTVGEWLDYWLTVKKREVRPKSYKSYESTARLYLKPHIGHIRLDKLTVAQVRSMLSALQDGSGDTKGSTRNAEKAYQALNNALRQAVNESAIPRNVCDAIKKPKHRKQQRGAFETNAAVHILRTAAKRDDEDDPKRPKLASRWAAAFMTGARQAECLGMELDRLDFKAGAMDISWQLQRLQYEHGCGPAKADGTYPCGKVRYGYCPEKRFVPPPGFDYRHCYKSLFWTRPKSSAGERWIPMAPLLSESLKVHIKLDKDPNPHGLVWHHRDGRPLSQEDDNEQWNMLMAAAGIEKMPRQAVLHEARNTTATLLLESGVDVRVIKEIMGHASILQTREYQRVSLELGKSAVSNAFDALLPSG
ncbi:tyrosine integrase [Mycobacterium phage Winky]|uniref:Integrase n=1 Tax=Mycobacterium phage Faith1 TaxID=2920893 RepID=F6M833_9CAUD|nr:tyrosine integrase [Mycobacterium phage Faith1]AGK87601.1 tyrosine integrase [Mycobacterium phage Winky]AGM12647.1 tyrosine integrase [Mycobacterium phage Breezona]ASM62644.1 tyrosine integrase [Mycobacterium phage Miley16]AYN57085.1 tyrosine integrase [Mycobacterium phage BigCheese]QGJ93912.1 tyrosine integrase [Mycobacterium phage BobsGarage]QGZ17002.1 tyrosine integrase [Mycobacterium phage Itos]QSM00952.1 tyrosine integrase [Mycobacterium phage Netyap]QYW00936.1 tyrosine integrase [M